MVKTTHHKERRKKDWLDRLVEWLRPGCHIAKNPKKGKRGPRKIPAEASIALAAAQRMMKDSSYELEGVK